MSQIILDFSGGNTCLNDQNIIRQMIDELRQVDSGKHEITIKWQLFKEAGDNIPLAWDNFIFARYYAADKGYRTTASVFDKASLNFLLQFEIPFVKLANNKDLNYLIGLVPRKVPVYQSFGNIEDSRHIRYVDETLYCISEYPASVAQYEYQFGSLLRLGISDHTNSCELFKKYSPRIYETHYRLENSIGLDAGEFAKTAKQLQEVIE